jgi:hypothetical protein
MQKANKPDAFTTGMPLRADFHRVESQRPDPRRSAALKFVALTALALFRQNAGRRRDVELGSFCQNDAP